MKLLPATIILSATLISAAGGNFGVGVMLGEPTGFNFKLWTVPQKTALDLGIGWGSQWGDNYGFDDTRCYDGLFFHDNKAYCQGQRYYGPDRYYGWRSFHVHGDYLIHDFHLIKSREKFPVYYGPGLVLDYWRGGYYYPDFGRYGGFAQIGARGVLGISWIPRSSPFDIFLEVAPVFDFIPFMDFWMNASLGARFYF